MDALGSKFKVGDKLIDAQANEIDGRHVGTTAMNVLVCLANAAPDAVPRETLINTVWPRAVVGDNALDRAIADLRRAFDDDAKAGRYIETIPRRGYRLAAAVQQIVDRQYDRIVAFVPLSPIDDDPALAVRTKVISENLLRELTATTMTVVLRHSTEQLDGATHLLEGSVRTDTPGETIVALRLLRAEDRRVLWVDNTVLRADDSKYPRAPFVARMIESCLHHAETRPEHVPSLRKGLLEWSKILMNDGGDWRLMMNKLHKAAIDAPKSPLPLHMLVVSYCNRLGGTMLAREAVPLAHYHARKLLELDPDHTFALGQTNWTLDLDYESAIVNFEHARRHPRIPEGIIEGQLGKVYLLKGDTDAAIDHCRCALATGSFHDQVFAQTTLARSLACLNRLDDARREIDRALALSGKPGLEQLLVKTWICRCAGDTSTADQTLDEARRLYFDAAPDVFPFALACAGERDLAERILADNEARWQSGKLMSAGTSFRAHVVLENIDEAFRWLDRAVDNREALVIPLLRLPDQLVSLRTDPRFAAAVAKLDAIEATGSPTTSVAMRAAGRAKPRTTDPVSDRHSL